MLLDKHHQAQRESELGQDNEALLERLDIKKQKYSKIRSELESIQDRGLNIDIGVEKLKEEISLI